MKTKFALALALILGVFLAGCANSSDVLNKIHIGMTKDEVTALLGPPDSKSAQSNVEYLTYYLYAAGAYSGYGRDQPYMVRLVDGKVESFGRFAQLFDLYNRPINTNPMGTSEAPPPPAQVVVAQPARTVDYAAELERLSALRDKGVITQDEFDKLKAKLIGQ